MDEPDFDWVTAQAECTLGRVFEALQASVKNDVERRNALSKPGDPHRFFFTAHPEEPRRFEVVRDGPPRRTKVIFTISEDAINVLSEERLRFRIRPALNPSGICRLHVEGNERFEWEIRRTALWQLFFGAA